MNRIHVFISLVSILLQGSITTLLTAEEKTAPSTPLKVLNYNVFNGFRGGKSYGDAVKWVNTVKPDIAGWQELVGWNEERLKNAAKDWNHPYAATMKSGGYNIGLTSRTEIEVIKRETSGFWHGYLHCRTAGIDVIVCHLWPGSRRGQLLEATQLRDLVQTLQKEGRQVMLMGDFNAHSASDQMWVDGQQPLIERRLPSDSKRAIEDRFIVEKKWNFDVMERIFETSLVDVVRDRFDKEHAKPTREQLLQLGSFPSLVLNHSNTRELQSGFLERIDFILVSKSLAERCTNARVVRDVEILESISDHYPIFTTFE